MRLVMEIYQLSRSRRGGGGNSRGMLATHLLILGASVQYVSVRVGAIDDVGDAVSVVGAAVGASVKEYE